MSFTMRSALLATVLLSTQAAATEFSFLAGNPAPEAFGNSFSQTLNGLTATATAVSTLGKKDADPYETAALAINSGGMGVCSRSEGLNCSTSGNMHALDNAGGIDLILFRFSSSVRLNNLTLLQLGGDSDLSLWAGTGSQSLADLKTSSLGRTTLADNTSRIDDIKTVNLSLLTGTYDWLAISARLTHKDDFALLRTLNVQTVATPVPEADTWTLLLAGLGLVGFAVRRRT